MPYRRKPRSQRKHDSKKVPPHVLKKYTPEKRSLVKFGIVPQSVKNPETHQPLTKQLASSAKKERDAGISSVQSILSNTDNAHKMDKDKMTQLWKALFYSFWMSDKVLIQQELARKLANIIKICGSNEISMLYIECFMECMEREWKGIDFLRMNKFLSLVRSFIHSSFDFIALNEWNLDLIEIFSNILRFKMSLTKSSNRGLFLHLCDVYIDELVKINRIEGDDHLVRKFRPPISFDALYNLLLPFITIYLESNNMDQQQYVIHKVFYKLLETMSFDKDEREMNLNRPGYDDIDLYKFDMDAPAPAMDCLQLKKNGDEEQEQHLMFDKKNFDVVMPFREYEGEKERKKVTEWEIKYENTKQERENDPFLLKNKMEEFRKVFSYLANHEETPKKAIKKLNALSKLFVFKDDWDKYYNRSAIKSALKVVDKRKQLRKWNKMKKEKKKLMRTVMKQKTKWNKMKKKGMKIKPNKRLLKRASRFIL